MDIFKSNFQFIKHKFRNFIFYFSSRFLVLLILCITQANFDDHWLVWFHLQTWSIKLIKYFKLYLLYFLFIYLYFIITYVSISFLNSSNLWLTTQTFPNTHTTPEKLTDYIWWIWNYLPRLNSIILSNRSHKLSITQWTHA